MRLALTAAAIRAAEADAVAAGSATLEDLMQRAGEALAEQVARRVASGTIAVVTGKGNNGGDGWVAARVLRTNGRDVRVLALADPAGLQAPAASAASAAIASGVPWEHVETPDVLTARLGSVGVIVDAIFGLGFSGAPSGIYAQAIRAIEMAQVPVVAADVPSGIDADTGMAAGPAVHADLTVTFSAHKPGLLQYPGAGHAGEIVVADVGLDLRPASGDAVEVWEPSDYRAALPVPGAEAHKGNRGSVLLVAGSRLYGGSAVLAAAGAMRMGAGYVFAAVPASVVPVIQAALPHVIAVGLAETAEGTLARESVERIARVAAEVDAVVLGPGLTTHAQASAVARELVESLAVPLVLDADGINALGPGGVEPLRGRGAPTIVTPHPGELARLLDSPVSGIQEDRVSAARRVGDERLACVLKGARTVVAGEGRTAVTLAGNPGMATAGTGDVLAGMTGTLLAQGLGPFVAGALAAYIHGRAGDLAAQDLTEICLTAKDLPSYIPRAVRELIG